MNIKEKSQVWVLFLVWNVLEWVWKSNGIATTHIRSVFMKGSGINMRTWECYTKQASDA
jgi:hypothetical protein